MGGRNRPLVPVRDRHPQSRQQTTASMHLYHGIVSQWNWDANTLQVKKAQAKQDQTGHALTSAARSNQATSSDIELFGTNFAFKPGGFTEETFRYTLRCVAYNDSADHCPNTTVRPQRPEANGAFGFHWLAHLASVLEDDDTTTLLYSQAVSLSARFPCGPRPGF